MSLSWIPSTAIILISLAGLGLALWRIYTKKLDEIAKETKEIKLELRILNGTVRDGAQKTAVLAEKLLHKQDKTP